MGGIKNSTLKRLFANFAGLCVIPDCAYPSSLPNGTPLVEIAFIVSPMPEGPRPGQRPSLEDPFDFDNLVLICPTHHRFIDDANLRLEYTSEKLRMLRDEHVRRVARVVQGLAPQGSSQLNDVETRMEKALGVWRRERRNSSEEFWQSLFTERPELLTLATHGQPFVLNSKCYVGGKAIDNRGGNVVDFLAQCDGDVILIEIKTPTARLLGAEYRTGVFPPSVEVSGAVAQALNYRLSLLNELPSLRMQSPSLSAHHVLIIVIAGDADGEGWSEEQRRSFSLYRQSLKDVNFLTYDELFASLQNLTVFMQADE